MRPQPAHLACQRRCGRCVDCGRDSSLGRRGCAAWLRTLPSAQGWTYIRAGPAPPEAGFCSVTGGALSMAAGVAGCSVAYEQLCVG